MKAKNNKNVVFLTNILPPYRLAVFQLLTKHFSKFKILLSTQSEGNRDWEVSSDGIDVEVQRNMTLTGHNKHSSGFKEDGAIHIPFNTITKLYELRPDVIVSAELGLRTLFSTFYKLLNPGVRFIVYADLSEYTESSRGLLRYLIRKFILRYSDSVIVNGEAGRRYINNKLKYKGNVYKIPYPSDKIFLDNFKEKKIISNGSMSKLNLQILYVGQLIPRKGLIQFIDVLSSYIENKDICIKFVLVGDGELKKKISSIKEKNLIISCVGHVGYDELFKYYLESDISVLPTLADTWALVVNESMSCGVPVLGSKYSQAIEEMVQHGVNGWIYDPMLKGDLYKVLDHIVVKDLAKLDKISFEAYSRAKQISAEVVAKAMIIALDSN